MKTVFTTLINNKLYIYAFCRADNYANILDTQTLTVLPVYSTGKSITSEVNRYLAEYKTGVKFDEEVNKKSKIEKELKLTLRQIEQTGSHLAINELDNNYEVTVYNYSQKYNGLQPDYNNTVLVKKNSNSLGNNIKKLLTV